MKFITLILQKLKPAMPTHLGRWRTETCSIKMNDIKIKAKDSAVLE
jgi:hypothetical protein